MGFGLVDYNYLMSFNTFNPKCVDAHDFMAHVCVDFIYSNSDELNHTSSYRCWGVVSSSSARYHHDYDVVGDIVICSGSPNQQARM